MKQFSSSRSPASNLRSNITVTPFDYTVLRLGAVKYQFYLTTVTNSSVLSVSVYGITVGQFPFTAPGSHELLFFLLQPHGSQRRTQSTHLHRILFNVVPELLNGPEAQLLRRLEAPRIHERRETRPRTLRSVEEFVDADITEPFYLFQCCADFGWP
jgi:hypothetical protein